MTDIAKLGFEIDSASLKDAKKQLDGVSKSASGIEAEAKRARAALAQIRNATGGAAASKELDKIDRSLSEMERDARKAAAAVGSIGDQAQRAGREAQAGMNAVNRAGMGAQRAFTGSAKSAKELQFAMRTLPAQITDITIGLASGQRPLMVLLQQGGQVKDMFGGIGAAVRALGSYIAKLLTPVNLIIAALGVLFISWKSGSDEALGYAKAIAQVNHSAGVSVGQLSDYAKQLDNVEGVTQHAAAGVLQMVTATGKFSGEAIPKVAQAALQMKQVTGAAIDDTVAQFQKLSEKPVDALIALNEQYHFLKVATLDQIQALEDEGRAADAAAAAQQAYAGAIDKMSKDVSQNLGWLEKGWNAVKTAAKESWDAMLGIGREGSLKDQIAKAEKAVEVAQAALARAPAQGTGGLLGGMQRSSAMEDLKIAQMRLDTLKTQLFVQNKESEVQQRVNKDTQMAIEFQQQARKAMAGTTEGIQQQVRALSNLRDAALRNAARELGTGTEAYNKKQAEIIRGYLAALKDLTEQKHEAKNATQEQAFQLSEYDKLIQSIQGKTQDYRDQVDGLTTAQTNYRHELTQLADLLATGQIDPAQFASGVIAATQELTAATSAGGLSGLKKMQELVQSSGSALDGMKDRLSGASRAQLQYNATIAAADKILKSLPPSARAAGKAMHDDIVKNAKQIKDATDDLQDAMSLDQLFQRYDQKSPFDQLIDDAQRFKEELDKATDPKQIDHLNAALDKTHTIMAVALLGTTAEALRGIQSMTKQGSKEFAALEIAADSLAVAQAVLAVLNQGNGDPYSAFFRMAAMAAAVAPLLANIGQTISGVAGSGFTDTAKQRQATQGTGSVLGDSEAKSESILKATDITASATEKLVGINTGMLRALQQLQQSIGGASGMLARGAGQADFSGMNLAVGSNKTLSSIFAPLGDPLGLFKGKSKITDQGIQIMGGLLKDMLNNITAGAYQEVQSKSWAFGSTKTKTGVKPLGDDLTKQFQLILKSIVDTVREGAKALGLPLDEIQAKIDAFRIAEQKISLKGLSAEDQQKELEAVFSKIFDDLVGSVVPFVEQFQKVGEGLGETLVRVATEVQVTREAMKQLGLSIAETDPEKFAQISDSLIEASGGIDKFIEGMQSFASTFAPESFQFNNAQRALESALSQVNLSLPDTAEGMWALMQSLDASTEAGREQIATLLRLSDTAKQYYDLLDKRAKASLDYAMLSVSLQAEAGLSPLAQDLLNIAKWSLDTTAKLNDLAKAAGMAGAKESDLALVHTIAAKRAQAAIQALMESSADLVAQLYGPANDAATAVNSFGSAMTTAADKAKDAMALLLGDLSPYSDRQKLDMALQGQRAGTVTPDEVLQIGRRLFASTAQYKQLFDQVMAVGDRTGANKPEVRTASNTQEIAKKTLSKAERYGLADQLANNIADLASAQDISFQDVADKLGLNLADLGKDLGLDNKALQDYLSVLASDNFGLNDLNGILGAQVDRLIAAITGQPYNDQAGTNSPLGDTNSQSPVPTGTVARNPVVVNSSSPEMLQRLDAISAGLKSLETKFDENGKINGRYLPRIAENTERGAEGTETVARNTREMVAQEPTGPRSTRSRNLPVGA